MSQIESGNARKWIALCEFEVKKIKFVLVVWKIGWPGFEDGWLLGGQDLQRQAGAGHDGCHVRK